MKQNNGVTFEESLARQPRGAWTSFVFDRLPPILLNPSSFHRFLLYARRRAWKFSEYAMVWVCVGMHCIHCFQVQVRWHSCLLMRLVLHDIEWSRTNKNRLSRCPWRHCRPLVTEIKVAEYGSCFKQKEALVHKSHRSSTESIPCTSWSTVSITRCIYFCQKRTKMTSETSENTSFFRF